MRIVPGLISALVAGMLVLPAGALSGDETPSMAGVAQKRRPVAAAIIRVDRQLCVANRKSGSLTVVDLDERQVISEQRIGTRLSDLAMLDAHTLLVTDEAAHELLVVDISTDEFIVQRRLPVARHPESVVVDHRTGRIAVAGLWSRRIVLLDRGVISDRPQDSNLRSEISDLKSQTPPSTTIRLDFSPRRMLFADEGRRLIVADAFGGKVAVIDAATGALESVRELPAQNIRGLTRDGDKLLLAHQILSPLARADFDDVHWGNLLRNVVRELPIDALLDPEADLVGASRVVPLGKVGEGAADPAGIVTLPELDGWITCLAGTGEVTIRTRHGSGRVKVCTQPTSIVWDEVRQVAYVLCTLDDSVAVVDPVRQALIDTISLGPQPEPTPADRGERLFVDGLRSHDGWISCQSCHPDGHTTGGLADTNSDTSYGTPKRILSLLGTRDNNPWAWNGQFRELHQQVASSFKTTLQGEPLSPPEVNDVVAYLHTLTPPPAVDDGEWTENELQNIERGRALFDTLRCSKCHVPSHTYTIDQKFDVGLEDEAGLTKFNPPSLRGVSQRERFFHDGRAEALESVFVDFGHQLDEPVSPDDRQALVMFLRSL